MPGPTGRIPLNGPISYPFPSGVEFTVAADASLHVMAKGGFSGNFLEWAAADTLTEAGTVITNADFRADVAATLGIVDGGSGAEIVAAHTKLSAFDTRWGIILGEDYDPVFGAYQVYGLRYSLDAEGVVSVNGAYRYYDSSTLGFLVFASYGQWVIGTDLYFIGSFGNSFFGFRSQLIILPLVGDDIVLTPDSWASKRYDLPGVMATQLWWVTLRAQNMANVIPLPDGTCFIWSYRTIYEGEAASVLVGTILDPTGGAPGSNSGYQDFSSLFGIPFADEGLNFAGAGPTVFTDDWYTNPSINFLADGRIEIFWCRGYSDMDGWIGVRRFVCNADFTGMTSLPLVQIDLSAIAGLTLQCVMAYRIDNSEVCFMIEEDAALTFKTVAMAIPAANKRRWLAEPGPIRSVA